MDWQPVNESILDEALAPNETQKIRMKRQDAVQQGAPDPEQDIPRELRWVAVALVRWRCLVRFSLGVTEERTADWNRANKVLDDLSSGAYVLADDGGDSTPRPHYSGRPIRWGPRTRNGVM